MEVKILTSPYKKCKECNQVHSLINFTKNPEMKDEHINICRDCRNLKQRTYRNSNKERLNTLKQQRRHANSYIYRLQNSKANAKARGLEWSITEKDIVWPEYCPVLQIKLNYNFDGRRWHGHDSPTIDRIDNSKGYIPGNVWIISHRANTLKKDATLAELEKLVEGLKKYVN